MNEDAGCICKRCWPSCQTVAKWWAVRCKTLRAYARDADLLAMVAAQADQVPALMTTGAFWKAVAQMGGYLARQGNGPPGWKTLWKGWLRIQTLLEGFHLAAHLRL